MNKPVKEPITSGEEYSNPVDKFAHLPETTRQFLEDLREDDITEIKDSLRFYRTMKAVGKFNAWLVVGAMTIFVTFVAFGEGIRKVLGWIGSGQHP